MSTNTPSLNPVVLAKTKIVCSYLGGSHLYGLNTPQSDVDVRYVFMNTDLGQILGLDRLDHIDKRNKDEDSFGYELRGFLSLLRKTNTQVMELLYAPASAFTILDLEFKRLVLDQYVKFIDSNRFFKSLKGYIQGERNKTLGIEGSNGIGGKRTEHIKKYGYSPKNMVQLLRLTQCGIEFFQSGVFPTNIKTYHFGLWEQLMEIKTQPEKFAVNDLLAVSYSTESMLDAAFKATTINYTFDEEYANKVILTLYKDVITKHLNENIA